MRITLTERSRSLIRTSRLTGSRTRPELYQPQAQFKDTSRLRSMNSEFGIREFPGGRVHQALQRTLVDWLERRLLLSLARREFCQRPQGNSRHKNDGTDVEFGFQIRRNCFPILVTPRCSQATSGKQRKRTLRRLVHRCIISGLHLGIALGVGTTLGGCEIRVSGWSRLKIETVL